MELEIVNPKDFANWNTMVQNSSDEYSIFHTSNWSSVLSKTYGFEARYFAIIRDNKFLFLLPSMVVSTLFFNNRGICLPFSDYCNPIISDQIQFNEVLSQMLSFGKEFHWKSLQLRDKGISLSLPLSSSYYYRHILSLDSNEKVVFGKFKDNYRKKIRNVLQGKKISVDISRSLESMKEYYKLHCITRKRQGMPPQPFAYFKNVYTYIIKEDLGFICLASVDNKKIAGAVYFHFGGKAMYKYSASDLKYRGYSPNYLVTWEAIRWLCSLKCTELCFGRTDPLHQGLIQFKDGWGTERKQMNYYTYDFGKESFIKQEQKGIPPGYAILKIIPVQILKMVGSLVYRYGA